MIALKTILNYSPNFDIKKRKKKEIKFIIFHYTGMRKENDAIKRLISFNSNSIEVTLTQGTVKPTPIAVTDFFSTATIADFDCV